MGRCPRPPAASSAKASGPAGTKLRAWTLVFFSLAKARGIRQELFSSRQNPPPRLRGRPIYGHPMDFRGLRHEPVNEQGVVLLFGMVAKELGYIVEAVQSGFPDCEAKRQIGPDRWQRVHLEFEFESRNFRRPRPLPRWLRRHRLLAPQLARLPSPPRNPRTLLPNPIPPPLRTLASPAPPSFRTEQADAFSSRLLLQTCRLAQREISLLFRDLG